MKKRISIFLVISIFFITLMGCGNNISTDNSKKPEENKKNVTVKIAGLKGPTSMGMIKMFEEKPSLGKGIQSNYEVVPTPDVLISKLVNSEFDIAAIPVNAASTIYNKTGKYKFLAMNTWGMLYIVSNGVEVDSIKDLKDKKVYVSGKGMVPDFAFRYILKENGLNPEKDLNIDYTLSQHEELSQALISGKIKIALLPEPFVTMVTSKNKDIKVKLNIEEEWKKINNKSSVATGCLVVRDEFAKENPEVVDTFLKEYEKSINWVNNNKEQASVLIEKFGILPKAKIAEMSIPRCSIRYMNAQDSKEKVNGFLKVLYDFTPKSTGGKLPDENFYYKK
ncbi:NMT1/THI5 like protein [Clostridium acetireducens DSM 10703]|uniref:NMT1/THI5 like protein n=1 Tax=Clostridium acetireducens DSM 10703 TaxID=1121290 RepID=A0A1E8EW84_9CLOT|nr:ABC transporter substrate-binding protein [Clostridium acetireducens]OFI01519.1 NMT1/THI5 like protein [Clostridium acetireducens DSM 10703]